MGDLLVSLDLQPFEINGEPNHFELALQEPVLIQSLSLRPESSTDSFYVFEKAEGKRYFDDEYKVHDVSPVGKLVCFGSFIPRYSTSQSVCKPSLFLFIPRLCLPCHGMQIVKSKHALCRNI
jgi:hypothetical protein